MTRAFGFRAVDNADRPLQPCLTQSLGHRIARTPSEEKTIDLTSMKQGLVALGKRWSNAFALSWSVPIGGCGDGPVVRCKPDQHCVTVVSLASQLPDIHLHAPA